MPYKKLLNFLITVPIEVPRCKIRSLSFYLVVLLGATKKALQKQAVLEGKDWCTGLTLNIALIGLLMKQ